ncbi:hypothetical protein RUM43_014039 [Polyplax serrata]|uniref:NADP-dependent oxidoreductase domain-containing protein n=1 Tax=Polyplax serrata TaxID=468196 RepID=A0AAN8PBI4_POLSC
MFTLNNGNSFPLIGFGTYLIRGTETIRNVIDISLAAGYRSFDTAAVYGNEEDLGKAFEELLPKYNLKRSDIFITTKLSPLDQGKGRARAAALNSLKKLNQSYVDLYLIHWPGVSGVDVRSDENSKARKESWFDIVELHKEGLLRNIGVSNYTVSHLKELLNDGGGVKPVVNQVEYHPLCRQTDLLEFCKNERILLQAYSSLGGTGKTDTLMNDPVVKEVAEHVGKSWSQVLLKWALQNGAAIIPKSTTEKRIYSNIDLNFELSKEDMNKLNSLNKTQKFAWDPASVK